MNRRDGHHLGAHRVPRRTSVRYLRQTSHAAHGAAADGVGHPECCLRLELWGPVGLSVCLTGVGAAMIPLNCLATIADAFPPAQRGKAMGWVISATRLGTAFGVPLVAFLTDIGGWRLPFYVIGALLLLLWGLLWVWFSTSHPGHIGSFVASLPSECRGHCTAPDRGGSRGHCRESGRGPRGWPGIPCGISRDVLSGHRSAGSRSDPRQSTQGRCESYAPVAFVRSERAMHAERFTRCGTR